MISLKSLFKEKLSKEIPRYLYHGTFGELIPFIKKQGLLPSGNGGNYPKFDIEKGVYLTQLPKAAIYFAAIAKIENKKIPDEWLDKIAVITIDTENLDKTHFRDDPEMGFIGVDEYGYDAKDMFLYEGPISPNCITKIEYYNRWGRKI